MGKKSRKLRSPKYAVKALALRETVARLRKGTSPEVEEAQVPELDTAAPTVDQIVQEIEEVSSQPESNEDTTEKEIKSPNALKMVKPEQKKEAKPAQKKASTHKKHAVTTSKRRTVKTKTTA